MSAKVFQLTKLKPVWLHFEHAKFWEISINYEKNITTIRCGRLLANDIENENKSIVAYHNHQTIQDAIEYLESHVRGKLAKGYHIQKRRHLDDFSSQTTTISEDSQDKRLSSENSGDYRTDIHKKVHRDEKQNEPLKTRLENLPLEKVIVNEVFKLHKAQPSDNKENLADHTLLENFKYRETSVSAVINASGFKGTYMVLNTEDKVFYYKIQVQRRYLKTEYGVEGSRQSRLQYQAFDFREDAIKEAQKEALRKEAQGFTLAHDKFIFKFDSNEVSELANRKGRGILQSTSTVNSNSSEQEEWEVKVEIKLENDSTKSDTKDENSKQPETSNKKSRTHENPALLLGKPVSRGYDCLITAAPWNQEDLEAWYMTEKLGGIRCFWNGSELWSSQGMKYNAPHFFVEHFPETPLDGMLYLGQGQVLNCLHLLRKAGPEGLEWNKVKFVVHDAPKAALPFEARLETLRKIFMNKCSTFIELAEYIQCESTEHMQKELEKIGNKGGKGLVLKDPKAMYTKGIMKTALEIKSKFEKEAVIIEHVWKDKKGENLLKSLRVRNRDDNKEFGVFRGLTKEFKSEAPPIGSILSYKYNGVLASGKPIAPFITKISVKECMKQ